MLLPALHTVHVTICILFEQAGVQEPEEVAFQGFDLGCFVPMGLHLLLQLLDAFQLSNDLTLVLHLQPLLLLDGLF